MLVANQVSMVYGCGNLSKSKSISLQYITLDRYLQTIIATTILPQPCPLHFSHNTEHQADASSKVFVSDATVH